MKQLNIVLADDHQLVRMGFRALLEKLGVTVVGEATDGQQAIQLAQSLQPDVMLMDIAMPNLNGLEATTRIAQTNPNIKIIILTMHATAEYARRAIRAGAMGYLLKNATAAELEIALDAVSRNEMYICSAVSKYFVESFTRGEQYQESGLEKLSSRQREILQLIAEGNSRREIAEKLNISVKTFDSYRAQLMDHLNIHDVAGLVRFATRVGLVSPDA
ncbi:MAG: response regulator transcription factor [Chloroflexi bacterium]|nr:response regulator transcription factor [Chloroflexota bacterium]